MSRAPSAHHAPAAAQTTAAMIRNQSRNTTAPTSTRCVTSDSGPSAAVSRSAIVVVIHLAGQKRIPPSSETGSTSTSGMWETVHSIVSPNFTSARSSAGVSPSRWSWRACARRATAVSRQESSVPSRSAASASVTRRRRSNSAAASRGAAASASSSARHTCSAARTSGSSSHRSRLSVTERICASMRAVNSRTARFDSPSPTRSPQRSGSLMMTCASLRNRSRSRKTSPIATIGKSCPRIAAAPIAMRAAPVLSGARRDAECVIPSGKIPTTSPAASAACTSRKESRFCESLVGSSCWRYTGTDPTAAMSHPISLSSKSGALVRKRTVRPAATTASAGSTSELLWFATSSTGPVSGSRAPATVTR